MKKMTRLLLLVLMMSLTLLACGCTTTKNTIINKSYDVSYDLTDLEDHVTAVAESALPAVVTVCTYSRSSLLLDWSLVSTGSGAIIKGNATMTDGTTKSLEETKDAENVASYTYYAVTNAHVVSTIQAYALATVILDGTSAEIKTTLVASDSTVDLALLSFTTSRYITPLAFGDSSRLKTGAFVLAFGSPEGVEYAASATFGIVSNPRRTYASSDAGGSVLYIQHDADINPGSSGGPLVNLQGELIGLNVKRLGNTIQSGSTIALLGMNFAIPSNIVKSATTLFLRGKELVTASLSVSVEAAVKTDPLATGVRVIDVQGDYFALGDVITTVNGLDVSDALGWDALTRSLYEGSGPATFSVARDGVTTTLVYEL